jgi:hypothetical protein
MSGACDDHVSAEEAEFSRNRDLTEQILQLLRLMEARLLWLSPLTLSVCWSAYVFAGKCVHQRDDFG